MLALNGVADPGGDDPDPTRENNPDPTSRKYF